MGKKNYKLSTMIILFIVAMIIYPLCMFWYSSINNRLQQSFEASFDGYDKIVLLGIVANIVSALIIIFIIWTVIEIVKCNYKVGILPIVITICIELVQCLIFFTGGATFYNILMFSRLPNYMNGIAIIMCFSIIYTIYVSRHQKKIQ